MTTDRAPATLTRSLGLWGLAATGICSMMGAAINIIPVTLQRTVPGVGPYVVPAYLLGALPAILAALAYAVLGTAMPRAGGSYVYASRSLNPYLGFVASFSQWFGVSFAIGIVSYVLVVFLRDMATAVGMTPLAAWLGTGPVRLGVALGFLWLFAGVNYVGLRIYERTLIPLMVLMLAAGAVVIVAGFRFDHADFAAAVLAREGVEIPLGRGAPLDVTALIAAAAVLFSTFIGFDSIAQAGGEARRPERNLPLAIGISVLGVGTFYILFTAALYHTAPWSFVAEQVKTGDVTAPGLLGYVLSPGWALFVASGAAIALVNDLPAMLLSVSRLVFAWAEDGIFPRGLTRVSPRFHSPSAAILLSAGMATVSVVGCQVAGDFLLAVDILVTSMLVNFLCMCVSVLVLPHTNPEIARGVRFGRRRGVQWAIGLSGTAVLGALLVFHVVKDLRQELAAWYFHSTWAYLVVLGLGSAVFAVCWRRLRASGVDLEQRFALLPPQ